jgi:ABC-2 type transport system permease protein
MNIGMIFALVKKDFSLYFKNKFFGFITILALVAYIGLFFLMPKTVDEKISLGFYAPSFPKEVWEQYKNEEVDIFQYSSLDELKTAIENDKASVGFAFPDDFLQKMYSGAQPSAQIYIKSDLPDEYREAYTLVLEEITQQLVGHPLNITTHEMVIGTDMAGMQIPPRNRMLPNLAILILMVETMGLAALISSEVESGTLRALLVTRLRPVGLFISKGITGVAMAFSQVLLLLVVTGGLQHRPWLILTALFLGSILITGISFLVASLARDVMSVIAWGMIVMIVLAIPSFNVILPGLTTDWIKVIPSYYLVDVLNRVFNYGMGWQAATTNLLVLLGLSILFFTGGVFAIRRKMQ